MKFGERVRELRKQQRMSQQELAARAGIDFTYLSKIENSRMWTPSEKVIHRVAKGLGADADELIVLADKLPSDLAQQLKTPERIKALRRELAGDYNSVEVFRRAFG
jgi:transcriptional regulator with XRE-family HTH domain